MRLFGEGDWAIGRLDDQYMTGMVVLKVIGGRSEGSLVYLDCIELAALLPTSSLDEAEKGFRTRPSVLF